MHKTVYLKNLVIILSYFLLKVKIPYLMTQAAMTLQRTLSFAYLFRDQTYTL
jgi:hypothetical protein